MSRVKSSRLAELHERIATFHIRVEGKYQGAMACRRGCSDCCHQHLSVYAFEFERIKHAVDRLQEDAKADLRDRLSVGASDPRCPLLDERGACRVYEARPTICRSHGLPIHVGDPPRRDVCPLNFQDGPAAHDLPDEDVLNVNSVNAILGVLDHVEGDGAGKRIALIDGLSQHLAAD